LTGIITSAVSCGTGRSSQVRDARHRTGAPSERRRHWS
jgi:hypothetical protein